MRKETTRGTNTTWMKMRDSRTTKKKKKVTIMKKLTRTITKSSMWSNRLKRV
jgi:hypothetical protein